MSYRTKINDVQIFGNNESYDKFNQFIKDQGIEIDEDGCYDGYTTDFMGMLTVLEKIVMDIWQEQKSDTYKPNNIFDFTSMPESIQKQKDEKLGTSLFDDLHSLIRNGYGFIPYAAYLACRDMLEPDDPWSYSGHMYCYHVKPGERIHLHAG